jgi:hypothetical protein
MGGAFFCFPLGQFLGSDQPFYMLDPYKFDGLAIPPTFEAIAAAHLKSLRAIQPEGPYLLGGWCNGGLLAYEMARQLHAEGQTIDLLILMDPVELVYPVRLRFLHTVISRLGDLIRLGQDKQLDWFLRLRHIYTFPRHVHHYLLYSHYRRSKEAWRWDARIIPTYITGWLWGTHHPPFFLVRSRSFGRVKSPFAKGGVKWRKLMR